MKTIIKLLIIPFLLLALSSANAQTTVWSQIEKQYDVTLPAYNSAKTYTTGVSNNASTTTADCIAIKFAIRGADLVAIKNNPATQPLFEILHQHKTSTLVSRYHLFIRYVNDKFQFMIERNNDFLAGRKLSYPFTYFIEDILIPSNTTTTEYFGLLLSDYGAILWQDNNTPTVSNIRTAPLFFGYPSNRYAGTGTVKNGVIDYLKYNSSSVYDLKITNYKVDNFLLRKPTSNFKTLSQMILKNSTNPILNERLSGESISNEETSIDDSELFSSNIKLHPNPSNGQFNIDLPMTEPGNVSFEIFNINGQKVFEQKQVEFFQGQTTHHIDTQNKLTSGVYFLNVTAPNFSQKTKLIIK